MRLTNNNYALNSEVGVITTVYGIIIAGNFREICSYQGLSSILKKMYPHNNFLRQLAMQPLGWNLS